MAGIRQQKEAPMRFALSLTTLLALAAPSAWAQDPVKVASSSYTVLAENARVRVLRGTLAPGGKAVMHEHPAHVAVSLTNGDVQMRLPDGTTSKVGMKAETAMLMPAGQHEPANLADSPLEVIVIELKGEPGTAVLPTSRPGMKMTMLLEDPRVMAYRVAFDPAFGEPEGTTHDYDQVVIPLGASDTMLSMEGKTMSDWKRGDVTLIGRGVAHVSKAGTKPADMIIVAIR